MPSVDFLTKSQRSERMAKIRSSGTKREIKSAKALRKAGLRFREQVRSIAGKPDFAHRKRKMAIFVHGCFWHGHSFQARGSATRPAVWSQTLAVNKRRDARNIGGFWQKAGKWLSSGSVGSVHFRGWLEKLAEFFENGMLMPQTK